MVRHDLNTPSYHKLTSHYSCQTPERIANTSRLLLLYGAVFIKRSLSFFNWLIQTLCTPVFSSLHSNVAGCLLLGDHEGHGQRVSDGLGVEHLTRGWMSSTRPNVPHPSHLILMLKPYFMWWPCTLHLGSILGRPWSGRPELGVGC